MRLLRGPALVTFAVASDQLADLADDLRERGYRPRGPVPSQRKTPAADVLAPLVAELQIPVTVTPDAKPWLRARLTGAFGDIVLSSVDASIAMRFA